MIFSMIIFFMWLLSVSLVKYLFKILLILTGVSLLTIVRFLYMKIKQNMICKIFFWNFSFLNGVFWSTKAVFY